MGNRASTPDIILQGQQGQHTLLVSHEVLFETAKVLRYPRFQKRYGLSEEAIYDYVSLLRTAGMVIVADPTVAVPPSRRQRHPCCTGRHHGKR